FAGWFTDETFVQKVRFPAQIRQSVTYYAKFAEEAKPVFLTFFIDGEVFERLELRTGDTAAGNTLELPVVEGKTFDGWYTDEGCTAHAAFPIEVSEDLKFYGKMCPQGTVRFLIDGEAYKEYSFLKNGSAFQVTAPETETKEGLSFSGWYLDKDYRSPAAFPLQTKDDMTLYGRYVKNAQLTGSVFSGGGMIALIAGLVVLAGTAVAMVIYKRRQKKASM
ncbi:MAG: InlB B-repeat-containing protein, partial [Lachnospiraceae bacterium]|nr:InlB B-repeat-containing protein [Lachnospiraceae bacterium]